MFGQESKQLVVLSHSDTHTDTICKDNMCSTFYISMTLCFTMTAYYRAEARECLVTAKRDFLFYLHHAHIVSYVTLNCADYINHGMNTEWQVCAGSTLSGSSRLPSNRRHT